MTQIKNYYKVNIQIMNQTPNPGVMVRRALDITQKKEMSAFTPVSTKTLKFLLDANHTSVLEHAVVTFFIENVSRSFLAQITRHRMASYTASSQHYQEYSGYCHMVSDSMAVDPTVRTILDYIEGGYKLLIEKGYEPEEARQILPNSKAVNILWTINARSLVNFLNLRLCYRNTREMLYFAQAIKAELEFNWWPELFGLIGPDCEMKGYCTQGKMTCGRQENEFWETV